MTRHAENIIIPARRMTPSGMPTPSPMIRPLDITLGAGVGLGVGVGVGVADEDGLRFRAGTPAELIASIFDVLEDELRSPIEISLF
jgi:hypothetical protein